MGRHRGRRHVLGAVTAVLALGAGCADDESAATADCQAQVRVDGEVYTGYAFTEQRPAARFATAEVAQCHDTGPDAPGSVFTGDGDEVAARSVPGHDREDVLAVRFDARLWEIYFSDSVSPSDREDIARELSSPTRASRSR
jgi:hypothetical protein